MSAPLQPTSPVAVSPHDIRHPFGLPLGSVRGMMSIMICSLVWVTLLLPPTYVVKVVLAHFFLMGLVLMAFASAPRIHEKDVSPFLPWLLRVIFVLGTVGTVAFAWFRDVQILQDRLTPDVLEVKEWWIPFLGSMVGGFSFGLFVRFLFGKDHHIFQTVRAWLSVVGMILLALELAIFLMMINGNSQVNEFLHYWQCITIVTISAYFGTRA